MDQADGKHGTDAPSSRMRFSSSASKIGRWIDKIDFWGNRIGVSLNMICAAIVFLIAIYYMPGMEGMARNGWGIVHDAVVYYQRISWTVAAIKYTAIGALECAGGVLAYIALLIPAVLSAIAFCRGGVRLIRLIAGR